MVNNDSCRIKKYCPLNTLNYLSKSVINYALLDEGISLYETLLLYRGTTSTETYFQCNVVGVTPITLHCSSLTIYSTVHGCNRQIFST
jgi:hypothetical protein